MGNSDQIMLLLIQLTRQRSHEMETWLNFKLATSFRRLVLGLYLPLDICLRCNLVHLFVIDKLVFPVSFLL